MAATTQVQVIITAQDNASGVIDKLNNSIHNSSGVSAEAAKGAGIVAGAFTLVGAAALAATGVSVKMASDFQSAMTMIQTNAGASAKEVDNMTQAILKLAPAVGQTPTDLANALYYIESAGYRGAKALDILKLSAEGAAVGHADLTKTADALTTVMNSGIKGITDAGSAMGVMNAIVGNGKMKMDDLIAALSSGLLPSAKQVGLSIQDVGAALDVMTNNGIPASDAANRLRMTLSLMESPTSAAKKALDSVGLSSTQLANDMRNGGIIQAVTDLNNHMNAVATQGSTAIVKGTKETAAQLVTLGDNVIKTNDALLKLKDTHTKTSDQAKILADNIKITTDKLNEYKGKMGDANTVINTLGGSTLDAVGKAQLLTKAFGGARSGSTIELLTQQVDQLKGRLQGINQTSNDFAASWQKTQSDNDFAMKKLNATVQTLAVQYGTLLLPIVTKVANFLSSNLLPAIMNATKFFEQHKQAVVILAGIISGLLVMAFIALGVVIWTSVLVPLGAFFMMGGGIVILIVAIGAAIGATAATIIVHWGEIMAGLKTLQTFFIATWNFILNLMQQFVQWVISFFAPGIKAQFDFIKVLLIVLNDAFILAWAAIQNVIDRVVKWLLTTFNPEIQGGFNIIKTLLKDLSDVFTSDWAVIQAIMQDLSTWFTNTFNPGMQTNFDFISKAMGVLSDKWAYFWDGMRAVVIVIAEGIVSTVKSMLNSVIGFFNGIIGGANKVGSKIPGYITIPSIPSFQTGGVVPGPVGAPALILAHGGETVVPQGLTSPGGMSGNGSGQVVFNVNIGLYAGTETEQRNIAKKLYGALLQLAQSQHKTVQQYMGG